MKLTEVFHFFEEAELIYRLSKGLEKRDQGVIFLVGAALSAPLKPGNPGVLSTEGMIDLIRAEFSNDSFQREALDRALAAAGDKRYQTAFLFMQGRLGQATSNEIVKKAVLGARLRNPDPRAGDVDPRTASDDDLRILDFDSGWELNPGTEALGKLVAHYPKRFGKIVLTTNFDPLIEAAIRKADGEYFKTALHADGNLSQTEGRGCHVVHLHGYWYGSDTLHTVGQLQHTRPHLRASLASLLRNQLIVVCGYGGWDDVFTDTIFDVVSDDAATPEILWTFLTKTPVVNEHLESRISAGANRGRVSLYQGVDCNLFFPALYEGWTKIEPGLAPHHALRANPVQLRSALGPELMTSRVLQGDDEDRPPVVDLCVGREIELQQITNANARVIFVTGIGGQGKSTLAAQYFANAQRQPTFNYYVWRDCKEESERFENQLASVVETLSGGRISGQDLSKQDIKSIVQLFMTLTARTSVLLVFDNMDHYVSLEAGRLTSSADLLIRELLSSETSSRVVLTCRPLVDYSHPEALSCHLGGISLEATRDLFAARNAVYREEEITDAHIATDGHAFWLDLLALQTVKQSAISLRALLDKLRSEGGLLPERTLASIWETLNDRQKLVLRSMAEAVRPEKDSEIADHLHSEMNYQRVIKALSALKSMNLVVVKRRTGITDVFELHPLVRDFIWSRFSKRERTSFIEEILKAYRRFISTHRFQLAEQPTFTTLQYWTHTAELDIAAGRIGDAILTLVEAGEAFAASGYSREFCRTARILLDSIDWISGHGKYKEFDSLFSFHLDNLCQLGEWTEAEQLLDKFELSVLEKDARYIFYCDLKCFTNWTKGQFAEAVKWGKVGEALKKSSNVDTKYSVAHNLALAERDAGQPELALPVFLDGRKLEAMLDPDELDEETGGPRYGNVGRCLHFMGQIDSALICYQKSALLIEKNPKNHYILNQGYIRRWIGELLLARGQRKLAGIFLEAARLKWEQVSPPKATHITMLQRQLGPQLPDFSELSSKAVERTCLDWISGRLTDT